MKTTGTTQTNNTALATTGNANNAFLKNAAKYMMELIGEGIKQSLNGMDINVEFIALTARSLVQTSGNAAKNIMLKYNNASRQLADRRYQYNSNTTLSHS